MLKSYMIRGKNGEENEAGQGMCNVIKQWENLSGLDGEERVEEGSHDLLFDLEH